MIKKIIKTLSLHWALLLSLGFLTGLAHATEVYRCENKSDTVEFRDTPCPVNSQNQQIISINVKAPTQESIRAELHNFTKLKNHLDKLDKEQAMRRERLVKEAKTKQEMELLIAKEAKIRQEMEIQLTKTAEEKQEKQILEQRLSELQVRMNFLEYNLRMQRH